MKKVINWIKDNPLFVVLSMVSVAMLFIDNECGMALAMAAAVAPGSGEAPGAISIDNSSNQASTGRDGLPTRLDGVAATVSAVGEISDIIEPDVDDQITQIASEEAIIDTIKRKVKRQIRVNSFEVDHYMIDEKRSKAIVNKACGGGSSVRVKLEFDDADRNIFQPYRSVLIKGVDGYDATGQVKLPGNDLMVFIVGKDSSDESPIAIAVNGPKASASDEYCKMPSIPAGTEAILLSSAAYETQKFISPDAFSPVPERFYLQKQLCNSIVSDYLEAQKKRINFSKAQLAEAVLRQFRLESCRTAWVGQPGKFKVEAQDKTMGYQWNYFSKGLRWQFKRQFDLASKITFADLINLSMIKFTGFNCSKKAIWMLGKQLLNDIQQIDLTLHKNITMTDSKVFGIECTRIHTVFGDIELVHDPTLDALGYSDCGGLIDLNGLVRYYMKNEDVKTENVEGEEAERKIVMTVDCLALKGFSHIWVNGSKSKSTVPGAATITSAASLPSSPTIGDIIVLTAENGGFAANSVVMWNGSKWVEYNESVIL